MEAEVVAWRGVTYLDIYSCYWGFETSHKRSLRAERTGGTRSKYERPIALSRLATGIVHRDNETGHGSLLRHCAT